MLSNGDDLIMEADWLNMFKKNKFGEKTCQVILTEYTET